MLLNLGLRAVLKSSAGVLCESYALRTAISVNPRRCSSSLLSGPTVSRVAGSIAVSTPIRHYASGAKKEMTVMQSQLCDLQPSMLKLEYASVPLAQTTDDLVKRLLSLELASHNDKLQVMKEQLIAKVQRDEHDRSSVEVRVAILTVRIRNYMEHMQKHRKDKANKRWMLMAIDKRKKLLKKYRLVDYDAFERLCKLLGITYTFPPEYYRPLTKRYLIKKEYCKMVYYAAQAKKAEERLKGKINSIKSQISKSKA